MLTYRAKVIGGLLIGIATAFPLYQLTPGWLTTPIDAYKFVEVAVPPSSATSAGPLHGVLSGEDGQAEGSKPKVIKTAPKPVDDVEDDDEESITHEEAWGRVLAAQEPEDKLTVAQWKNLFSVRDLPCPRTTHAGLWDIDNGLLNGTIKDPPRVGLFLSDKERGTLRIRGYMMAAAVSHVPGWTAFAFAGFQRPQLKALKVDFCVLVKYANKLYQDWCSKFSKHTFWDILDNKGGLKDIMFNKTMSPLISAMLSPNQKLADAVRTITPPFPNGTYEGMQRAVPLYHPHTNPGFVARAERMKLDIICRVAIFMSDKYHSPRGHVQSRLASMSCSIPEVYSFAVYQQCSTPYVRKPNGTLEERICPNRSPTMAATCKAMDDAVYNDDRPVFPTHGCWKTQVKYHNDILFNVIDVGIIMGESSGEKVNHRPSTRMLHMMGHGVPLIFWKSWSYLELAEEGNYKLPSGKVPAVHDKHHKDFIPLLQEYVPGAVRLAQRERGLVIAANYAVYPTAKQLVSIVESPRRETWWKDGVLVHAPMPFVPSDDVDDLIEDE
mmetsp:Transcript_5870/g.14005  ORF Transcript_5870/g.14005 Transcript_5870/m.14005 type:complete len:551 (-) Transcript_5870:51-1703(-)